MNAFMKTVDGKDIVAGLKVFTYDWKWGTVDEDDYARTLNRNEWYQRTYMQEPTSDDYWFKVTYPDGDGNIYNGGRMTTTCPNCRGGFAACNNSGCNGRRGGNGWTGYGENLTV